MSCGCAVEKVGGMWWKWEDNDEGEKNHKKGGSNKNHN